MEDMKIVRSLEYSCLLIKGVTQTIKEEIKQQKNGTISMLLNENLLGNVVVGKGVTKAGDGVRRAGEDFLFYHILWQILRYKSIFARKVKEVEGLRNMYQKKAPDRALRDRSFAISVNLQYDEYQ